MGKLIKIPELKKTVQRISKRKVTKTIKYQSIKTNKLAQIIKTKLINKSKFHKYYKLNNLQKNKYIVTIDDFNTCMKNINLYQCPMCLQILLKPFLNSCGHLYCLHCVEQALSYQLDKCCLCRTVIDSEEIKYNYAMNKIISNFVSTLNKSEIQKYRERERQFNEYENKRQFNGPFYAGARCEFRINNKQWIYGIIAKVQQQNNIIYLSVRPHNDALQYYNFLSTSRNLANFPFFTVEPNELQQILEEQGQQESEDQQSFNIESQIQYYRREPPIIQTILHSFDFNEAFDIFQSAFNVQINRLNQRMYKPL